MTKQTTKTKKVKRRLNKELLTQWLDKNQPGARVKLVRDCDYAFSIYTLDKVIGGEVAPKLSNCLKIAHVTGIPLDELFPRIVRKSA